MNSINILWKVELLIEGAGNRFGPFLLVVTLLVSLSSISLELLCCAFWIDQVFYFFKGHSFYVVLGAGQILTSRWYC
jgi:hypothetical protein